MELNGISPRDKVAVVTGGGQSLGLAISRALRNAGAQVVIAEVNDETGAHAAEELDGTFIHTDVTDPDSVRSMVGMVMDEHGRVDVLVNNAGIVHNIPSEEVPTRSGFPSSPSTSTVCSGAAARLARPC